MYVYMYMYKTKRYTYRQIAVERWSLSWGGRPRVRSAKQRRKKKIAIW